MSDDTPELPALPRFRPGDHVADCTIEGPLGDDAKHVYRAREIASGRSVALKIVPVRSLQGVPFPERTNGIANVVTTFAAGIDPTWRVGFVVMEFVSGPSLADCIDAMATAGERPTPADRRRWIELLLPVARGLHALHCRGVVHCDVKPHNIVIESTAKGASVEERAVLVDLGIARHPGVPAVQSTLMHAAAYSAPEQVLGQRIDARTDVFAFGVTMHDVLLARPATRRAVRPTLGLERLDRIDGSIDLDLAAIVGECTALAPQHRYADMSQLAADLACWLSGRRPGVRPRSPWGRFVRLATRQPRTAAVGAMVLGGIVSVTSFATIALADAVAQRRLREQFSTAVADGDFDVAAGLGGRREDTEGTRHEGAPEPVGEVLALLRRGEAGAARRRAACWCSQDGLTAHPRFDRWFTRLLGASERHVRIDAARLLARALYDRPRTADEPMPLVANALMALARDGTGEAALFAVTALGGLADLDIGDALLLAAERQCLQHENAPEFMRLCVEAMHRVAYESRSRSAAWHEMQRSEGHLHTCLQILGRMRDSDSCAALVHTSVSSWLESIRRWRDAASLPAPDPTPLLALWPEDAVILGLGRSKALLADLSAGRWSDTVTAFELGVLVEYSRPSADVAAGIEAAIARDPRFPAARAIDDFGAGRASVVAAWALDVSPWQVDAGSRLADELPRPDSPQPMPSEVAPEPPAEKVIAAFDFRAQPAQLAGSACGVRAVSARCEWDESRPPCAFGWLGTAGRSAIELEFLQPRRANTEMVVWVQEQKGTRGAFPTGGEAGLDLLVDGVLHASWRDLGGVGERTIPLALSSGEAGRRVLLTFRLRADSDTTLRLYSVTIR